MASNKANADWWTETLKDLILHDQIWYNAIRALVSVESRSDSRIADTALDRLIREGLIDRDEKEVSAAMQQWLRYPAILADRLANSQGVLSKEVIDPLNFVCFVINQLVVFLFQVDLSEGDGSLPQTSSRIRQIPL